MDAEWLISQIIDSAIEVKRTLGAGFLESVYKNALSEELVIRRIPNEKEVSLTVFYKKTPVGMFRADLVVDKRVIIELKVCDGIIPSHEYQLVNYLRATGIDDGIILNFGTTPIGIRRKFRNCR